MSTANRYLGTAGEKGCKYGCLYCFTRDPAFKRCPRLDQRRTRELIGDTSSSEVVQPACDTELLLLPNWQDYLDELISTGKIISFATKVDIDDATLTALSDVNKILLSAGSVLHIGVTIVRLQDWQEIEPKAPSPRARILTLRHLWESGIATTLVVRPMLPLVTYDEIEELVDRTHRFASGYLSGPLYLTQAMKQYLDKKEVGPEIRKRIAIWQQDESAKAVIESPELEDYLGQMARKYGRTLFENNTEAALYANQVARREIKGDIRWDSSVRRERVGTVYIFNPKTREFLLMFHRKLGRWLAPGGHVEREETTESACLREAKEEIGSDLQIVDMKSDLPLDGVDFRRVQVEPESRAFCTIEEFIHPIGAQDPHIHVDSVYVATSVSGSPRKEDAGEVTAYDWFSLNDIENRLKTFDNVPLLCRAIHDAFSARG